MFDALIPARGSVVRVHGRAQVRARSEAGFSLIELLIVMIVLAILFAIALPGVRNASDAPNAPSTAIAGGTVWRAIQTARLESGGTMPAAAELTGQAAGLVDAAGTRRIRPWPETGRGEPIVITTSAAARPPATGTPDTLLYGVGGGALPRTGWLAGYGPKGQIVFQRFVSAGTPVVGSGAEAPAG